jgi:hypothetical protein
VSVSAGDVLSIVLNSSSVSNAVMYTVYARCQ